MSKQSYNPRDLIRSSLNRRGASPANNLMRRWGSPAEEPLASAPPPATPAAPTDPALYGRHVGVAQHFAKSVDFANKLAEREREVVASIFEPADFPGRA